MQMHQLAERARKMIQTLKTLQVRASVPVSGIEIAPRGTQDFVPFTNGAEWGQDTAHDWMDFHFTVTTPADFRGKAVLSISTGRESGWEAINPQFVVWVNGRIEQALDTQHHELVLYTLDKLCLERRKKD